MHASALVRTVAAATVAVLLAVPVCAGAQSIQTGPTITVRARAVARDGSQLSTASGDHGFVVGQPATSYKFAGNGERGDSLCSLGAASEAARSLEELVRERQHVWRVTTTATRQIAGGVLVDLDWARYSGGDSSRPAVSARQQLQLIEGRPYIIDLLQGAGSSECPARSVIVEIEAGVHEDAVSADRLVQYDLWLVHTDPAGRKSSQHIVTTGLHGMELPFGFSPLRFPVEKLAADQYDFRVATRVGGTLRGRFTPDGRIGVEMQVARGDHLERRDAPRVGSAPPGSAGRGRKTLVLAPGEVVAVALPATGGAASRINPASPGLSGTITAAQGTPVSVPAVTQADGTIRVAFGPFFEGHELSVLVRAHALD